MQHPDISPPLNDKGIKIVQGIVGDLLYVGRAVNKKLLLSLSAIGAQQAAATEETVDAIEQLLDYVATYPNCGIIFQKSDMILASHTDPGFLKRIKIQEPSRHTYIPLRKLTQIKTQWACLNNCTDHKTVWHQKLKLKWQHYKSRLKR